MTKPFISILSIIHRRPKTMAQQSLSIPTAHISYTKTLKIRFFATEISTAHYKRIDDTERSCLWAIHARLPTENCDDDLCTRKCGTNTNETVIHDDFASPTIYYVKTHTNVGESV